jgi:carbamoyl-phosphate synthase large subunit
MLFKGCSDIKADHPSLEKIYQKLRVPNAERIFYLGDAFRANIDIDKIHELTHIDRWFLYNIKEIIDLEKDILHNKKSISPELFLSAKEYGFSDRQLALLLERSEEEVFKLRKSFGISPNFKLVDTCAAEFKAYTPYFYSTYEKQ